MGLRKRDAVTALVRQKIADGTLKPGGAAPSGRALAKETGLQPATCRRALRDLVEDGTLTRGVSATSRLRVAEPGGAGRSGKEALRRRLSGTLGALRRAGGMDQPELASLLGVSSTTVGHAETGRLWQARDFWQRADALLGNGLLDLYDAYQRAAAAEEAEEPAAEEAEEPAAEEAEEPAAEEAEEPAAEEPAPVLPVLPVSVTITLDGVVVAWPDGTETVARPPGRPAPEDSGAGSSPQPRPRAVPVQEGSAP